MLGYFNLFLQKSWFFKTNNWSFCNKTTQDFAEFWVIWENFKAKTKTEDEGILRKGKRSSSWFFSLHIGLAEREENQIFCYAKHASATPPPRAWLTLLARFGCCRILRHPSACFLSPFILSPSPIFLKPF